MFSYFLTVNVFMKLCSYTFYSSIILLICYFNHLLISLNFYVRETDFLRLINFRLAKCITIIFVITYSMLVILLFILIYLKYRLKNVSYLLDYQNYFMKITLITAVTIAVINIIISLFCFIKEGNLLKSTKAGLSAGIAEYNNNQKSKELIDIVQIRFQCCGINSFKDWYTINWYEKRNTSQLMEQPEPLKADTELFIKEHIPFSCCSDELFRPCLHHFLQSDKHFYEYNFGKGRVHSFWKEGCLEKVSKNYLSEFHSVNISNLLVMTLCLFQFISDRIIQTADSTFFVNGLLQGWIFYPDLFLGKKNKDLKRKHSSDKEKHKKYNPFVGKKKRAIETRKSVQFHDVVQAYPGSEEHLEETSSEEHLTFK